MDSCNLAVPGKCLERLKQCLGAFHGLGHRELIDENTCPDVYLWNPIEEDYVMVLNEHPESSGEPARWNSHDLQEWLERKISEANHVPVAKNPGSLASVVAERKRAKGRPWFIVLELTPDEEKRFGDINDLGSFLIAIREKESNRLVADMPGEPMEFPGLCADALEKAQAIVREAGPESSDFEHLYLWSSHGEKVLDLSFFIPEDMGVLRSTMPNKDFSEWIYYPVDELLTRLRKKASTA